MYFQVIMPIGSNPFKVKQQKIISYAGKRKGIKPHFPTYTTDDPVFNLQVTMQNLKNAEFVLVDLSLERPSCYYELGLAEALDKPVYLIAEKGTSIHQTANRQFVTFYANDEELEALLDRILDGATQSSNSLYP